MNKILIFLIILIILFIIFGLTYVNKEKYYRFGLTPLFDTRDTFLHRKSYANLDPLTSDIYYNKEVDLPDFFMYNTKYFLKHKEQGLCGSCWALASINVLSDRAVIADSNFNKNLSIQHLLECIPFGCEGGSPEKAFKWMETNELTTEENIPYYSKLNIELKKGCPSILKEKGFNVKKDSVRSLCKFIEEHDYNREILNKNIINMKNELIQNGPFVATIAIYENFITFPGTSIYNSNKTGEHVIGGHALEIIGYCNEGVDTRTGFEKGYWICKNSWKDKWPRKTNDQGYFAIIMGDNECGIESRCCRADLKLKKNISKPKEKIFYNNYDNFIKNVEYKSYFRLK